MLPTHLDNIQIIPGKTARQPNQFLEELGWELEGQGICLVNSCSEKLIVGKRDGKPLKLKNGALYATISSISLGYIFEISFICHFSIIKT